MTDQPPRRRGVIMIDEGDLALALRLPPQWRLLGFQTDTIQMAILVLVEGDGLPECPPACQPQTINIDRWHPGLPGRLVDLPADLQHAAVLASLRPFRLEHGAVLAGRERLLRRHAPDMTRSEGEWCSHPLTSERWPCQDYLDAAGDLAAALTDPDTGLAEPDRADT